MTDLETLLAIEEIKALKSKYFYALDHKDWDLWREEVFAPDASVFVPERFEEPIQGFEPFLAWVKESTVGQRSVHHGHDPRIAFVSDTEATGVWAMEDRLYREEGIPFPDGSTFLHGFGHYRETYVRLPQGWRLKSTHLTRLRVERTRR